jgi:hypothetical protein
MPNSNSFNFNFSCTGFAYHETFCDMFSLTGQNLDSRGITQKQLFVNENIDKLGKFTSGV